MIRTKKIKNNLNNEKKYNFLEYYNCATAIRTSLEYINFDFSFFTITPTGLMNGLQNNNINRIISIDNLSSGELLK